MPRILTIEEVVDTFSQCIPKWQREVNLIWLQNLHAMLTEGGIWVCPSLGTIWKKADGGFERVGATVDD